MSIKKQTILITGANGYIGNHFCKSLIKEGHTVIAMIKKTNQPNTTFENI